MLDYALQFFNNYTILFYLILTIAVIIEWPVTILGLSLVAPVLWIHYFTILFFAFVWELFWDIGHYLIWKFAKKTFFKKEKYHRIEKLEHKLQRHSLFDKLLIIKYTPPITSIGLMYLWFNKISLKEFIKNDIILIIISSIFITLIWYNSGFLFKDKNNFIYLIMALSISLTLFYFWTKHISKYFIKKITNEEI